MESSTDVTEFGTALVKGRKDFLEFTTLYNGSKFVYMQGWKNIGFLEKTFLGFLGFYRFFLGFKVFLAFFRFVPRDASAERCDATVSRLSISPSDRLVRISACSA